MEKEGKIKVVLVACFVLLILFILVLFSGEKAISENKVLIIPIKGEITSSGSSGGLTGGDGASADSIVEAIKNAEEDSAVKAVIFEISSPGGTVVGTEEISRAIKKMKKPTVAWIREIGASGAYWIASSCNYSFADSMSLTGSIGVSSSYLQFSGLMDKYGISYVRLVAGEYKDIGSTYRNITSEEQKILEKQLAKVHNIFISTVAENRNLTFDYVKKYADGSVFLGVDAVDYRLIDETGSKDQAFEKAKNLAGIEEAKIQELEQRTSLISALLTEASTNVGYGIGKALVEFDINLKNSGIIA